MITVFGLFSPRHDRWDATGALRRGGRWNNPGTAVLYAASSLSLACLEILVHIRNPSNFPVYSYSQIAIPEHQIEQWEINDPRSPERRKAIFESEVLSREEGDIWIRNRRCKPAPHKAYRPEETPEIEKSYWVPPLPVRQISSAVVPQEWNYLIDPDDDTLRGGWSAPREFRIDPRLLDPSLR